MVKPPPGPLARLHRPAGYLAIGLMMPWPALAQGDVETTAPVSVLTREDLENIPNGRDFRAILDMHNTARAGVGSPPLRWNQGNAQRAQQVADILAETGNLQHSSRVGRENERENIVVGPRSDIPLLTMAKPWLDEVEVYLGGVFPDACAGDWSTCAHYTQMIWSTTTDLGCGYAKGQYVALVCRYSPPGNRDGRLVIELMPGGPAFAVNNPAAPAQPVRCEAPEPDEWIKVLGNAARQAGFGTDGSDPRDAPTDRQWQLALDREQDVQDRLMRELATTQGQVASGINAYLAAVSAWQEAYVYLASATTGLQGLLTNWLEAREVYEKADLAFAVANLGVGGVKLGFKAYRFLTAPRATAATAEAAAGATRVAGSADDAVAAAGRSGEAGAAAAGETRVFNRTLIPPGQQPNVPGMAGRVSGTSSISGSELELMRQRWQREVDTMRNLVDDAVQQGDEVLAGANRSALDDLLKAGPPTTVPRAIPQVSAAVQAVAELDAGLVAAGRQAGVNIENVIAGAGNLEAQNLALMRAIAQSRGWHDIPVWAGDPIANVLLQARKTLAGIDDARISPEQLEVVKSLKTYVESRGLNFADWLRTAAGEVSAEAGVLIPGQTENVLGIVRYFDDADIDLLLKVVDTGGDAVALRNAVSPVAQASLNGLARAGQAIEGCAGLDAGLALNGVGGTIQGAGTVTGRPTDAQLANVLDGTGKLGEVGLGNVIDQFGVTDRFTAGQSLPRAMVGEMWEFITSPSATTASFYYTLEAQEEYLNLLKNEHPKLLELGSKLADASNALENLQTTLERAGLSGQGSYLDTRGPADLRRALDNLERVYNSGSDDWKRRHQREMDARRDHINQKLAALAETVADLNALAARMQQTRAWLDSLRLNPDGSLRGTIDLFNPILFVRLGSISLYLRGMGADAFGLTSDVPFNVSVPQPTAAASAPGEDFEAMRARLAAEWREIDEAPETHVDPGFDEWLKGLEGQ